MYQAEFKRVKLEYVEKPVKKKEKRVINVSNTEMSCDIEKMKNALVGYVVSAEDPPSILMEIFLDEHWRKFGEVELQSLETGVFIFLFASAESKQQVLDQGPWFYELQPIILKPWTPNVSLVKKDVIYAPIWIKLIGLNIPLWSTQILSKIASRIGYPLFTDVPASTSDGRLSSPRICVQVQAKSELPFFVEIEDEDGTRYCSKVEYQRIPPKCGYCTSFGHCSCSCPRTNFVRK